MATDEHIDDNKILRYVEGNKLVLGVPLTLKTVTVVDGRINTTVTDFFPNDSWPVEVVLKRGPKERRFVARMDGHIAVVEDAGTLECGTYSLTVLCRDAADEPLRFKKRDAVEIVDETAAAGIDPGIEFNAEIQYLDAAVFLAVSGGGGEGGLRHELISASEFERRREAGTLSENTIYLIPEEE